MNFSVWNNGLSKGTGLRKPSFSLLFIASSIFIALLISAAVSFYGIYAWAIILGAGCMTLLLFLRADELLTTIVIALHIYVDWYLGLLLPSLIVTIILLVCFFLLRSSQRPWEKPRSLWIWIVFLLLAIYPAIVGYSRPYDGAFYYPNIIAGALLTFWLGNIVAKDIATIRKIFQMLAVLGTVLALHTIFQAMTGITLLGTTRFDQFLTTTDAYALVTGSDIHRFGSFFVDPNYNGTFLSIMLFLPLGLFVESSSVISKILYIAEFFIILPALLYTYSNGAWVAVAAGSIVFFLLVDHVWYRLLLATLLSIVIGIGLLFFSVQIGLQIYHASDPSELALRIGAWKTGINVIRAYPWTGVGLGFDIYEIRAEPYRDPAQYIPLVHPHNAYIEIAAKAGLPVLAVFLVLIAFSLWEAFYNRNLADKTTRLLFSGGIAAVTALCVNSWSINGWTLPPLAAIGWLLLGCMGSPLLTKKLKSHIVETGRSEK